MWRILFLSLLLCHATAFCQTFSLSELVDLTSFNSTKFNTYLNKKGYKHLEQNSDYVKYIFSGNKKQKDSLLRCVTKYNGNGFSSISFNELRSEEYATLKEKIKREGFAEGVLKNKTTQIFQKNTITIFATPTTDTAFNIDCYNIIVEKRNLPKARDIVYAEDLMALNTHENIAAVFGAGNVVKDVFIYPDGKTKNCSVLFPNTKNEAVFLWENDANYRDIAALRIGGPAHTKGAANYARPVEQNEWVSKQGIYIGMSLKELDEKNGNEIDFYGWDWNTGGTLSSNNNGKIDFKKISLVLSCFNCDDSKYKNSQINTSTAALEEDRKIHVATIIILPDKQNQLLTGMK